MIWEQDKVFCLSGKDYSYAFCVQNGKLVHTYYGKKLQPITSSGGVEKALTSFEWAHGAPLLREYGEFGREDFVIPSVVVRSAKTITTDFRYVGHEILQEKPRFGMPALRDGETLVVRLQDEVQKLQLNLYYSVYEEGLTRRSELVNLGEDTVIVDKLTSFCLDLPRGDYETLDLPGRPNGERIYQREKVSCGIRTIASARGISSHQHNPFLAVMEKGTDEDHGGVYALNLVYSGSFEMECESEELSKLRVNAGMKIMYGGIPLAPKESFSSPEAVCVYSAEGLGEMSRKFHRLYRKHLLNPRFVDAIRPIVLNSWESIVFNISDQTLCELVDGAKDLGIDMLVLDDGWFGCRDNDDRSLGDWYVHKNKLPNGLTPIVEYCKKNGMKFGLWFEPEAVNPDSDLFRAHPDWAILTEGREGVQFRNQYVLNLGIPEALDYVFERMCAILESADIAYVKWDMNRSFTDARDAITYHKHVLGVYELYERLTARFPDLFIEGCASGGGRFDPAILHYSPMIWTSDNTDAYARAQIQYSTSLCYPLQTMSNHVSVSPNLQTGRSMPMQTRGAIASLGSLGYELNLAHETEENRKEVAKQTQAYRKDAKLILTGDLYRLRNPYTDEDFSFLVLSEDKKEGYFVYLRKFSKSYLPVRKVRFKGLDLDAVYEIEEYGERYTGAELCLCGIELKGLPAGDFATQTLHLRTV